MTTRTFSQTSLEVLASLPPAKRGPNFRTVSVFSYSSSGSEDTVEVPEELNSREFLTFAGFDDEIADLIWRSWSNRSASRDDWVVDDARYYIKRKAQEKDVVDANEDWDAALKNMGLSMDLRQRILDPEFDRIRLTRSASEWAVDTIDEAFEFLSSLSRRIDKKRAEISRTDTPDSTLKPRRALRQSTQKSSSDTQASSSASTSINIKTSVLPKNIEGRTLLYKGGAESRLERCVNSDGTLNITALHSQAPTDFHPERSYYLYLTRHTEVARIYAKYVEKRVPPQQAAILSIAIPKELLASAREIYGDDWNEMIWSSRNEEVRRANFSQLPPQLQSYAEADILVGAVCTDSPHKIVGLKNKSDLTRMRLQSRAVASQHVIQSIALQVKLNSQCEGFVWVTPITTVASKKE